MSIARKPLTARFFRVGALLALVLVGAASLAGSAAADPNNKNSFTFDVVCDGQPMTITVMVAAKPPASNGFAGHVAGSTGIGVLMGLSVTNLLTGEDTVILARPIADRQELATCTYTFEPLQPPFLVFTATVLFTPRG